MRFQNLDLILELEEARKAALKAETPQSSAAVAATMGKAKMLGFDKQIIELTTGAEMIERMKEAKKNATG